MKPRRFLVTTSQPIAIPVNGTPVFTSCLVVEEPLLNNQGKPLRELAKDERWDVCHTNLMRAVALGDGRALAKPIECIIGGYQTIAFAVELPSEEA